MKCKLLAALAIVAVTCWAVPASADTFGFLNITNNSIDNGGQYFVDVTDPEGPNNVLFTFKNVGPNPSFIAGVYFDDGSLLNIATLNVNNVGTVAFGTPATPGDLPGGNNITPAFVTTANFSADNNQSAANGVNVGEEFGIIFNLSGANEFTDVLAELQSGALRIGIHVQGISPSNLGDSFVNDPPISAVPIPPSALLMASGLLGLGLMGLRRRQK